MNGVTMQVISFRPHLPVNWRKTRISCESGKLFIDPNEFICRIEIVNLEDRYSRYVRTMANNGSMLTPYTLCIDYAYDARGIFASHIEQRLHWDNTDVESINEFYYAAETNFYRNPFKYKLATNISIEFDKPIVIEKDDKALLERVPDAGYNYWRDHSDYNYWKSTLSRFVCLDRLLSDMGMDWESLCRSTEKKQADIWEDIESSNVVLSDERREAIMHHTELYRKLFFKLFGKEYYE